MNVDAGVAIRLIGGIRVSHDGHDVDPQVVGGRRCAEIIAYLAAHRHRDVSHEELARVVWADRRPQSWYAGLRQVLSRVRDTMDIASLPANTVRSRGGNVRLTLPDATATDLEVVRAWAQLFTQDPAVAVPAARDVIASTEEPVLIGSVGHWADEIRAEVNHLRLRALDTDAVGSLALGELDRAISSAETLVALDPLQESSYRVLMRGYVALGEHGRALQTAARCRQVLADQLSVVPSQETENLYLRILRNEVRAEPAPSQVTAPALAHRATPTDNLIERRAELRTIADAVDRAGRGSGQFVVLRGEAGSGKTSIALEALERARAAGVDVLFGRCSEEAVVSFEPFVEAVGHELDALGPTGAREWLRERGTRILRLVPDAAQRFGESAPVADGDDRAEVMTAVFDWLTSPSRTSATLLVIDDLQWASAATLAVIRYVVHASEKTRLCVVATVREEYTEHPDIRTTLLAPTRSSGVHRLRLRNFSVTEVSALVESVGATVDPLTLHERTQGLPLFVMSLLGSQQIDPAGRLPDSVADSVAQRIRLLTGDARDLMELCSVVGMTASRAILRSATPDLDDLDFADALDDLVRQRLVAESESGHEVLMRHPLVQESVYADISEDRRRELHTRAALALEKQGTVTDPSEYARLAYHFSRGMESGRDAATDYYWRAGDSAVAIGAYEDAVVLYQSADERLRPPGDSEMRCRLQVSLGRAQRRARDAGYRATLLGAADMAQRLGDVDLQVGAALANEQQGVLAVQIVVDTERIASLYAAVAALESTGRPDGSAIALLLAQLAVELIWATDDATRRDMVDRATAAARSVGDRDALIAVLTSTMIAVRGPQLADRRKQAYAELTELLAASPRRTVDPIQTIWIARAQIEYGELPAAAATVALISPAQIAQDAELAWLVLNTEHSIDVAAGRLERCEHRLEALRAIPASPTDTYSWGRLLPPVFKFRILRGDLGEVVAAADGLRERFEIVDFYRMGLAVAYADVGELDKATDLVDWYTPERIDALSLDPLWLCSMSMLARAAAHVSDADICAYVYDILVPFANETVGIGGIVLGVVHHHLADLAIALDDLESARVHTDHALQEHDRRGFRGWYAETAALAVRLDLRRTGEAADHLVARARRCATDTGATAVLRRLDAALSAPSSGHL
ncbi:ATP-binding protein [Williamsia phyllosphaerae]|uniref:Bacterial transcriptional activator domain-containing protein n=1 Tax=Williamsia phyllosphaerae TaxID=885042 RepID=A0ABQ1U923_9NOCA|nr:AAA family ATPase [Williamsia phyllosphaerae]GGF12062.1 hypothetical protein GCM10007298_05030 [Williamsia phyllosphaerae]